MICPNCGHENPDGSRFCNDCGERLTPEPVENQTTGTPEKTLEPEPEPQAAEPQPKEPEPVEPEPVEPGSQLEESLPAEPELDLTDEEKAPQPEEPLPTNGMPVPVPVTESDDATAGPAVAAQISKAHG